MSYARWGWKGSHVYVFMSISGLECCFCSLQEYEEIEGGPFGVTYEPVGEIVQHRFDSTRGMVDHLALHRAAGHCVPDIEPALWADDAENFGGDA